MAGKRQGKYNDATDNVLPFPSLVNVRSTGLVTYELMLAYLKIHLFRFCMRAFVSTFWGTIPSASVKSTGIKDIL